MFVGEAVHTFQLDHQNIFNEEIGKVFSDSVALLGYGEGRLGSGLNATKAEFSQHSALVDFLEESSTKGVGDFKDGT